MVSKRKMTWDNWFRLFLATIMVASTIISGWQISHHPQGYFRFADHIFFAFCSLALIARTIYSYVKGE